MAEELSWWADQDEKVLGFVFRDITDDDFGWQLLGRDQVERFTLGRKRPSPCPESSSFRGAAVSFTRRFPSHRFLS
ncbi:hypothetical protein [Mesorhizobium kowhaii]|uniref:hypothetical protein n=1 Tax=Mesorhizobium kowhaii TaxID=1300272 RepID=UPI0011B461A1|nr:hypothetical protein [Mesorhizobium kowhaii]